MYLSSQFLENFYFTHTKSILRNLPSVGKQFRIKGLIIMRLEFLFGKACKKKIYVKAVFPYTSDLEYFIVNRLQQYDHSLGDTVKYSHHIFLIFLCSFFLFNYQDSEIIVYALRLKQTKHEHGRKFPEIA